MRLYVLLARIAYKLMKLAERVLGIKRTVYVQERVGFYRDMWAEAAAGLGFEFRAIGDAFWEVRDRDRTVARLHNYVASIDDPVTLDMAGDKLLVYGLLEAAGLPVPAYAAAKSDALARIVAFARARPGPFVVKPARDTASGLGITTNVLTVPAVLRAAALAFSYCDEILIEDHVVGESYRLLYLDHELICASRRTGMRVTGDGSASVAMLLESAAAGYGFGPGDLKADPDVRLTLARQSLEFGTVPEAGTELLVRSASPDVRGRREIRTVYTEDVSGRISSELIDAGSRASRALGSVFCGVDVITVDPARSLEASGGVISEINTTPGLHHHYGLEPKVDREPLAATVLRFISRR